MSGCPIVTLKSVPVSRLRQSWPALCLLTILAWCLTTLAPVMPGVHLGSVYASEKGATNKQVRRVSAEARRKAAAKSKSASKRKVAAKSKAAASSKAAGKSKIARKARSANRAPAALARPTLARAFGLHHVTDPAGLRSSVAYLLDVDSGRALREKNADQVLPIASITKLMTVMVVLDAEQPMREMLTVTRDDIDRLRGSSSRLPVGTRLSRREMIQLALLASENRAANALGRHYPGGLKAFVSAMNAKARLLGLLETRFADPTGLSGANVSSAHDLARLLQAAAEYKILREDSTLDAVRVDTGYRVQRFGTTNPLVRDDKWDVVLQKTGYISEAGRCLAMLARVDGRLVAMVFLDAQGSLTRIADARRARRWLEHSGELTKVASAGEDTTH